MDKEEKASKKELIDEVEKDVAKKLKAEKEGKEIMFGLGFFGIVGWSITVPTLLSIALGVYLDKKFPSGFSWTLTLIFVGVILGAFNAWRWLNENR